MCPDAVKVVLQHVDRAMPDEESETNSQRHNDQRVADDHRQDSMSWRTEREPNRDFSG